MLKNQIHPASDVENFAVSQIRMSRRERMLARYTKIGTTRWRHKRKKHEDVSPLLGWVLFSTVISDAIISGFVNFLTTKEGVNGILLIDVLQLEQCN